jgi:hypothetical protein
MNLKINNEFKSLITPLTTEEYQQLEKNLLKDGCLHELIVWDETIIDGHNRYEICQRHNIPFKVKNLSFESCDDAKEWIIRNQFGRRNLTPFQRSELALKLRPLIQAKAKENLKLADGGDRKSENAKNQGYQKSDKVDNSVNTIKELAKLAGVSHNTIFQVDVIQKEGTPEIQEKVREGDMSISKAYKTIRKKEGKLKTQKENKSPETPRTCSYCGRTEPEVEFASYSGSKCRQCHNNNNYLRQKGLKGDIELSPEEAARIVMEMKTKKPSEEGILINPNPIVTEFEQIVNDFCCKINPYAYMNGNLKELPEELKLKMYDSILKVEEWISKIKNLLEVR